MAVYRLSVTALSRSHNRNAVAAAAYRAGQTLVDHATGTEHDYSRKEGVLHSEIVLPPDAPEWAKSASREELWNRADAAENRKNSTVAREVQISLPHELSPDQRQALTLDFAAQIADQYKVAVDVSIHAPNADPTPLRKERPAIKDEVPDAKNHHAHLLLTTRQLRDPDQPYITPPKLTPASDHFGDKTRDLDGYRSGAVAQLRVDFCELQNKALDSAGLDIRVDHRTLEAQLLDPIQEIEVGDEHRHPEPDFTKSIRDPTPGKLKTAIDAMTDDELRGEIDTLDRGPSVPIMERTIGTSERLDTAAKEARAQDAYSLDVRDRAKAAVKEWEETFPGQTLLHNQGHVESDSLTELRQVRDASIADHMTKRSIAKAATGAAKKYDRQTDHATKQIAGRDDTHKTTLTVELELRGAERGLLTLMAERYEAPMRNLKVGLARVGMALKPAWIQVREQITKLAEIAKTRAMQQARQIEANAKKQQARAIARQAKIPAPVRDQVAKTQPPLTRQGYVPKPKPEPPRPTKEQIAEANAWQSLVDTARPLDRWHRRHPDPKMTAADKHELHALVMPVNEAINAHVMARGDLRESGQPIPDRGDFRDRRDNNLESLKERQAVRFANAVHTEGRGRELGDTIRDNDPDDDDAPRVRLDAAQARQQVAAATETQRQRRDGSSRGPRDPSTTKRKVRSRTLAKEQEARDKAKGHGGIEF